ncbi:MAG: Holliday junction resolvase RuvX [Chitinispirillaceae bacterium]|nr:Holliday junction resolvase RuvX [Chitinispirillaceae bacterium]
MRLIGVDYGRRRIGLAVTDETGAVARGLPTIDRKKFPDCRAAIAAVIASERPGALVFGLPLDADGRDTAMAAEIRTFAEGIKKDSGLPVYFVDESLTSVKASELLRFRKKKDRRDKTAVDRIAACLILEQFIREQKPAVAP